MTAMAATAVGVGGLLVASFVFLVHRLLAVSPLATSGISPFGIGLGTLNTAAPAGGGTFGQLARHSRLSVPGANNVLSQIEKEKNGQIDATRLLALHHDAFWVSYQPASRFWIFQGIQGAILIVLAAPLVLGTLWVVRRRA